MKKPDIPNVVEAIDRFFADIEAQKLSGETLRKYQNLLRARLLPWCSEKGIRYLKQLTVEEIRQFRAGWTDSALYASKNLERLRSFFRFSMHDDWIVKNPARAVKAPKVTDKPTLPFTRDEMERILNACDRYPGNQERLKTFVLTMRYSGLRIGDVIQQLDAGRRGGGLGDPGELGV